MYASKILELHICLRYSWWPVNNDSIFLHSRSRSLKIQDGRHASLSIKTLHLEFLHFSVINGDKDVNIRVYDDARFCGRLKNVIRWQCTKKYKMAAVSRNYNFYCKWRPFCFFLKKIEIFLDIYLSYELRILENIQIHTSIIAFVSLSWTLWPTVVLLRTFSAILDLR